MLLENKVPFKYIVNKVKYEMLYVMIVVLITYIVTHEFYYIFPEVPLAVPAFLGTSISVLLSFKLNQSYDRWWEARKIWGSIVNDSRTFVIQLQSLVAEGNTEIIKKMAYRQMAWCYSLGQSLRGLDPLKNASRYLSQEEIASISAHKNKPLAMLQQHAKNLAELRKKNQLETFTQVQLDNTLLRFCDSMGRAERIKSTVFPVTYRLFLHFAIFLFIVTLSISLSNTQVYLEIPLLLSIAAAFFLLEKTAKHMQDPFSNKPTDTAMTTIATTIEINIRHLLNETEVPEPDNSDTFYLL